MTGKRVLILTQYFPPEMGAPQARLSELGERLVGFGWQVNCLTALPNYPGGRVFPGYHRRKPIVETVGSIRTARVPLLPANRGFLRRLLCYFSFVISAIVYGPKLCPRPDLLFVESPPLFIGFAARALCRSWRCNYVFNVSDLWPESAVRMGVVNEGLVSRLAERLELSFYRRAGGVTGQSVEIIESIRRRCPQVPTEVITNGVEPGRFGKDQADSSAQHLLGSEPGPVFIYAGLLGLAQGLDQILDLAKALPDSVPGRFVLVGDGPRRNHLSHRINTESISRVKLLPPVAHERVPALLGAADAAIISLGMSIPGAVPSKIYESMASALPILLIAEGEAATRVTEAQCGLTVPPGNKAELQRAYTLLAIDEELRQRLGAHGRKSAENTYDRNRIAARLDTFLKRCLPAAELIASDPNV
jgi:glycosyltransferase involved in cell wall biosynthesis